MISRRLTPAIIFWAALCALPIAAQTVGIQNGVLYGVGPADVAASDLLPELPAEPAGAHGFVGKNERGEFFVGDGDPIRFVGVTMQWSACFPDTSQAAIIAGRLRKLGVNLVRFEYMDHAYVWDQIGTFLDRETGFRTLDEDQMRRFDRFFWELKSRGIYSYITLQSARAPLATDGLGTLADSALWLGQGLYHLYPQAREAEKQVALMFLGHVNPHTRVPYKSEPAIAMIELLNKGSILALWRLNYLNYGPGQYGLSWHHSRKLDTLWAGFLTKKYGNTTALATAWRVPAPTGGFPDQVKEGSFEGDFEQYWTTTSFDGPTVTPILKTDSAQAGSYAMVLRVRNAKGNLYNAWTQQTGLRLKFNTLYRLSFKAKSSNAAGRPLAIYANEAADYGMSAGLSETVNVTPYWKQHEIFFLVPIQSSNPISLTLYFGDVDGELSLDDMQLREHAIEGLQPGESLASSTVVRVPWGQDASYILPTRRVEDQSEFYMSLDREYFDEIRGYLKTIMGAKQLVTGASPYWASTYQEADVQKDYDFTTVQSGWDYVSTGQGDRWEIRNYSLLRQTWGGPIYDIASYAHAQQPLVAAFSQPFPNRYQAESMVYLPAYAMFQGWDGLIWDTWSDARDRAPGLVVDSAKYQLIDRNPVVNALLPVISHAFRNGLLAEATTTVGLRHTEQQARLVPRMEWAWGRWAFPGSMPGFAMANTRIVVDSTDAVYFTQRSDVSFTDTDQGEVRSDTRQIFWEYNQGVLTLDAPKLQGATGSIGRSEGVSTENLEIDLQSSNETATVLWTQLDTARVLGEQGRSLLLVASRTEPRDMHWVDSMHADRWGSGPMVIDPVRATITFKGIVDGNELTVDALDSAGNVLASLDVSTGDRPGEWKTSIDQTRTPAMWYSVNVHVALSSPDPDAGFEQTLTIASRVNPARARGSVDLRLAGDRHEARVVLLDMLGRSVATLRSGPIAAGSTRVDFETAGLPAGVYFVRASTERGETAVARVIVAR